MKIVPLIMFFLSGPVFAVVTNSMTIYEADGSTQTGRVITFGRPFVQGEFASGNCPRPVIGGTPIANGSWQFDLKNSWPDSSVKFGIVSFIAPTFNANGSLAVTFQSGTCNNSGMSQAQMVGFNGGVWGASIEVTAGTTSVTRVSNAKDMLNDLTFSDCKLQHWLQGPVVDQVIVQDCTASTAYDFGWTWNGSTMTYAVIGTSNTASLHPNFALSFYPSTGTVAIDFGIENMRTDRVQDQNYKFVLKASSPLAQVYSSTQGTYADASGYFTQLGGTRWIKTFYSNFAFGNIRIDHNFPYLIATKYYPSYDLVNASVSPDSVYGSGSQLGVCAGQNIGDYQCFINGDKGDINGYALIGTGMNDGNDKGKMLGREDLEYLYNMGTCGTPNGACSKALYILTGIHGLSDTALAANVSGGGGMYHAMLNQPTHQREGRTSGNFYCPGYDLPETTITSSCGSGQGTTVGHGISRHAHPELGEMCFGYVVPSTVGTKTLLPWSLECNCDHWADWGYSNYINTGAYWEMEEVQQNANYCNFAQNSSYSWTGTSNGLFVYFAWNLGARAASWAIDPNMKAAVVSLDGTAEKQYYNAIINSNLEILEGSQGITGTPLTPATTNYNCAGYAPYAVTPDTATRWDFGHCGRNLGIYPTRHEPGAGGCWNSDVYNAESDVFAATSANPSSITIDSTTTPLLAGNTGAVWGATGQWTPMNTVAPVQGNIPAYGTFFTPVGASEVSVPCVGCGSNGQPLTGTVRMGTEFGDYAKSTDFTESWMTYAFGIVINRLREFGFTNANAYSIELNKYLIGEVEDSLFNPWLVGTYALPVKQGTPCPSLLTIQSTNTYLNTWGDVLGAVIPPLQIGYTFDWNPPCGSPHSYPTLARAHGSFLNGLTGDCSQGTCSGTATWSWLNDHVPYYTKTVSGSNSCAPGNDYQVVFALAPRDDSRPLSSKIQGNVKLIGGIKLR